MTDFELAWVAGLLEGEGAFVVKNRRNIAVLCQMTDEDVLRKLHRYVGFGSVRGPYVGGGSVDYKPRWQWGGSGIPARNLMCRLLPLMGERRSARIRELLDMFHATEKVIRVQNILSQEVFEFREPGGYANWLTSQGVSESGMIRTLHGTRQQCRGWRRLPNLGHGA